MPIYIKEGHYCTTEEAAERSGITVRAVQLLLKRGGVEGAVQASERCWLLPEASVEAMVARVGDLKTRKVGRPTKKEKAEE